MSNKFDEHFNGNYNTSRYVNHSLEDDIMDAGCGKFAYEGPTGELIRVIDSRIDVWKEGDGNGNYDHFYYNGPENYGKAPDNRY